jgi:hypothetical protein
MGGKMAGVKNKGAGVESREQAQCGFAKGRSGMRWCEAGAGFSEGRNQMKAK